MKQPTLFDDGPTFTNRSTKSVTFQGKLSRPIHRWYRLTPSFSPQLANDIADHFALSSKDFVLDPFCGVGTVPLCMKYRGIPACAVELNPFLHFVGSVKTRDYADIDSIEACFSRFVARFRASLKKVPYGTHAKEYLRDRADSIPAIHHPHRWWSPGNLAQLVCLRTLVKSCEAREQHCDLLKMAVLGILIPVSNAKHNHVSLTFDKHPLPTVDVADTFERQTRTIVQDLREVFALPAARVAIYQGNSKELTEVLPSIPPATAVITSPPYPNRFSYARETRPHLFFFDFVPDARAVGQLETDAIGGTWGQATSVLARGILPRNSFVNDLEAVRELKKSLRKRHKSRLLVQPLTRTVLTGHSLAWEPDGELCRQILQQHVRSRQSVSRSLCAESAIGLRHRQQQVLRPSLAER